MRASSSDCLCVGITTSGLLLVSKGTPVILATAVTRQEDVLSTLTDGVLRRRMSAAEAGCCGWPRPMRQENVLSTPTDRVLRLRSGVAAEAGECPEWVLRLRPRPTRQENVLSAALFAASNERAASARRIS